MQAATSRPLRRVFNGLSCTCQQSPATSMSSIAQRWMSSSKSSQAAEAKASETAEAVESTQLSSAPAYPFSSSVSFPVSTETTSPTAPLSLLDRVNKSLLLSNTREFRHLFARRGKDKIPPGSIISVETFSGPTPGSSGSTSSFAGVLMAVKRRHQGVDDAFRVRALIGKPGVGTEIRFDVNSPWIKDVKVLRRDESKRRAKLYYIRRDDKFLSGVQGAIRSSIAAEVTQAQQNSKGSTKSSATKGGRKAIKKAKV